MSADAGRVRQCLLCGGDLPDPDPAALRRHERIAFDADRGRLWAVCPECGCWNATPFETRWEVVDACERLAQRASPVFATEHLSLLAAGPGELIRVGAPPRVEFAEWRYSSRLGTLGGRRGGGLRRAILALPAAPVGGRTFYGEARTVPDAWVGSPFIEEGALLSALFMCVPLAEVCPGCEAPLFIHPASFGDLGLELVRDEPCVRVPCGLCGEQVWVELREARPTLRAGLGLVSFRHQDPARVRRAVGPLERAGGPAPVIRRLCVRGTTLGELPRAGRLALWIALDELAEAEALEREWQTAETLARITDDELTDVPGFDEFRRRVTAREIER